MRELIEKLESKDDAIDVLLMDIKKAFPGGLLRNMMDKPEIKLANKLAKKGLVHKGQSDDRQKTVVFFLTDKGEKYLGESLVEGSEMADVVVRTVDSSIDLAETAQGLLKGISDILVKHKASKHLKTARAAFGVAIKEMEKVKGKIQ